MDPHQEAELHGTKGTQPIEKGLDVSYSPLVRKSKRELSHVVHRQRYQLGVHEQSPGRWTSSNKTEVRLHKIPECDDFHHHYRPHCRRHEGVEDPRHCLVRPRLVCFIPLFDLYQPLDIEVHREDAPDPTDPVAEHRMWNPTEERLLQHLEQGEELNGDADPKLQENILVLQVLEPVNSGHQDKATQHNIRYHLCLACVSLTHRQPDGGPNAPTEH
mmetsp:Transcript_60875/g.145092  ORF Transcript_60875/g.145092 Transcript_60875/m.145092 type:complete len:216 (+) Transcript_60875:107-754(+)